MTIEGRVSQQPVERDSTSTRLHHLQALQKTLPVLQNPTEFYNDRYIRHSLEHIMKAYFYPQRNDLSADENEGRIASFKHSCNVAMLFLLSGAEDVPSPIIHDLGKHSDDNESRRLLNFKIVYDSQQLQLNRNHVDKGAYLAAKYDFPVEAIEIVEGHHKTLLGGYPKNGKKPSTSEQQARLCDILEAATSQERSAFSKPKQLTFMYKEMEKEINTGVVGPEIEPMIRNLQLAVPNTAALNRMRKQAYEAVMQVEKNGKQVVPSIIKSVDNYLKGEIFIIQRRLLN